MSVSHAEQLPYYVGRGGLMTSPTTPVRELMERLLAAVVVKDLAATLDVFDADAILIDPHYPTPEMRGRDAIARGFRWSFKSIQRFGFTIITYTETADGQH